MPPQGGWQPQQPGGQPPYGPPPSGYPQYSDPQQPYSGQQQPPGFPQGPWPQQPSGPPPKGNSTKWLLIAIAVLLVIGVSIGATLLFTRDGGNDPSNPPTSGTPSDIASANDTGPVSIITEEPTCKAFNTIQNGLADVQSHGWGEMRSGLGPASSWTPEQRGQVEAVATAMRNSADQVVPLAKQTPHRVVREIYEQFIAYSRAYADSVADYRPAYDGMASVTVSAGNAISGICNAIDSGSTSRSLSLAPEGPPTETNPPGDPSTAERFISTSDSTCTDWTARLDKFNAESPAEWQNRDGGIPGSQWSPERKALEQSVRPQLTTFASEISAAGRSSGNPVLEDFALTAALYINAYVAAGDDYTTADGWLVYTGFRVANLVAGACRAVAG
ncbi:hypothetical protein ABIA65_000810 [Mycolicibacterium sp. 624]